MRFQKLSMGLALGAMLTTGIAAVAAAQAEERSLSSRCSATAPAPSPVRASPRPTAEPTTSQCSTSAMAASAASRSWSRNARPATRPQKGVECYEATKGKGALVYNPHSTGITLQLIPKAPIDKIPVLSMGYGLSAAAVGEKFPWIFNAPATYWSQASAVIKYIEQDLKGIKGKKIGFIYLDVGYGREPIPLLEELAKKMGFELIKIPVGVKEMQSQSSHWLQVRKERPDYMVMWGWGAMNPTAIKEAAKIRFPMDKFIGVWWSGSEGDVRPAGDAAKGYKAMASTARHGLPRRCRTS